MCISGDHLRTTVGYSIVAAAVAIASLFTTASSSVVMFVSGVITALQNVERMCAWPLF